MFLKPGGAPRLKLSWTGPAASVQLLLLAASFLLLLTACSRPPTVPEPVDPHSPPSATLWIADQSQMAGIGSYCWGEPMICADMIGVPTVPEPMRVASPLRARFEIAFSEEPAALNLSIGPIGPSNQVEASSDLRWWRFEQTVNYPLSPELTASQDLDLEPGLYLLALFASWEARGDVVYGFLIEVP